MSVRPSNRMEELGYHWTDFNEILQLSFFFFFRKSVEKIQVRFNFYKYNKYFT